MVPTDEVQNKYALLIDDIGGCVVEPSSEWGSNERWWRWLANTKDLFREQEGVWLKNQAGKSEYAPLYSTLHKVHQDVGDIDTR